jgi:molybdopterin synthase sulfur carrier subunit
VVNKRMGYLQAVEIYFTPIVQEGEGPAAMKIRLSLYASLAQYLPEGSIGKSCVMEVNEGTVVGELLEQLDVPLDSVKMIFLNGLHARSNAMLRDGDRVGVFPPVAGG